MRICSIGECMIEFSNTEGDVFKFGYAGDTANSAIYLSRLGAKSSFISSVGNDELSKASLCLSIFRLIYDLLSQFPGQYL